MSSSNPVPRLYRTVVDDVIKDVREAFLNEGVDEQVLQELKQLWESKLLQSRAIDYIPADASVRFTVSYPHNHQLQQAAQRQPVQQQQQQQQQPQPQQVIQQQPTTIQQQTHQQQPVTLQNVVPAIQELSQIVQNPQTGQVMYVNHPTLGDVGQMSLPATQAALAIQGATQHNASGVTASTSHALQGIAVSNTSQLPQMQLTSNAQGSQTIYANYPQGTASAGRGPRVIYTQPTQNPRAHAPVKVIQVDGTNDSSSDDDADDDDDDDDYSKFDEYPIGSNKKDDNEEEALEEDDPLNSGDDVSDDDPTELFDTDNVVVCQYDKIARSKNKWKFHLKDGIMNLTRKDFVFHKAVGESEW